jgi:5-deoxy-glucuronate isomerase
MQAHSHSLPQSAPRQYHLPAGSAATDRFAVAITPETAGWTESSMWILDVAYAVELHTGPNEIIVLPLSGSCVVESDGVAFELAGRRSVFDGPTDFAYVGRDSGYTITGAGTFALCAARADRRLPFRHVAAGEVAVELRGAGNCSREVRNFATADAFDADSIIACEVITPGGNWSSYPSHKHDRTSPDESELEEIYYFQIDGANGFGYHRVYGTDDRPIEVLAEVRNGDVVLVPHGYHGPSIAAPGYDMYYLNVMAGPGTERAWRIVDDPAHAWVRDTWAHLDIDPRLNERN